MPDLACSVPCYHHSHGITLMGVLQILVIIGLVLGIWLTGTEIRSNANILMVMNHVQQYDAALGQFIQKYNAFPGDMNMPSRYLPNCDAVPCSIGGNGNGIVQDASIGNADYKSNKNNSSRKAGINTDLANAEQPPFPAEGQASESYNFWNHLAAADLIEHIKLDDIPPFPEDNSVMWNIHFPASPLSGAGFMVQAVQAEKLQKPYDMHTRFNGHFLVLRRSDMNGGAATGKQAAQLDKKFDDGAVSSGTIVISSSAIHNAYCVEQENFHYNTDSNAKACVVFFRLSR